MRLLAGIFVAASVLLNSPLFGATFVVTNTADSGPGSLRQAMLSANSNPGADSIAFSIPGGGLKTIAPLTALPDVTNTVTIDGYSQPGSSANTLPNGDNAVLLIRLDGVNLTGFPSGLNLKSVNGCTIRGLIVVRFYNGINLDAASGNTIAGNWIGLDWDGIARGNGGPGVNVTCAVFNRSTGNNIGGRDPADRNVISGNRYGINVFPKSADHNLIAGNFIGTDATGTLPRGNMFSGVFIQSATNIIIGGTAPGERNVIAACTAAGGSGISILSSSGNVIQGNFIGTDVNGTNDLGNIADGVSLQGTTGTTIGGSIPGAGNRICNNRASGITLLGCSSIVIQGNEIGTDTTGVRPLGNASAGISLQSSSTNTIGASLAEPSGGGSNVIQFNGGVGISISSGDQNSLLSNRIYDNGKLGIDLGADDSTANDFGDQDTGANQLQNFPVLTNVVISAGSTQVQGTLNSTPNATFRLEFFASPPWDPSGIAEGKNYLGSAFVTTDANGDAFFSSTLPTSAAAGSLITATATDVLGNTSEFSAAAVTSGISSISMSITNGAGQSTICWPSTALGYSLEVTPKLAPPQWQTVNAGILDNGVMRCFVVTNGPAATNQFFRLRFQ